MAQLKKLLVAYDGSTQSKEALDWAIDLSLLSGAQVIAVKVSEPLEVGQAYAMYEAGYGATLVDQLNDRETNDKQLLKKHCFGPTKRRIHYKQTFFRKYCRDHHRLFKR